MPDDLVELAYPTLAAPDRVDWVDYARTQRARRPGRRRAEEILAEADGHAVFLVWMTDYTTFGSQCEELVSELGLTENLVARRHSVLRAGLPALAAGGRAARLSRPPGPARRRRCGADR